MSVPTHRGIGGEPFPVVSGYRLLRRLGEGVYGVRLDGGEVEQLLRILRTELATQPAFVERFVQIGHALRGIDSPRVEKVLDEGRAESGAPFVVTELLAGRHLGRILGDEGPLDAARVVQLARQACEGLRVVHAAGLTHDNLAPENLFVVEDGESLRLIDFGVGELNAYAAPERRTGSPADARSDVYALGVVLYEALSGARPVSHDVPPSRDSPINEDLVRVVMRCLLPDPAQRYATVEELERELPSLTPIILQRPSGALRVVTPSGGDGHSDTLSSESELDALSGEAKAPGAVLGAYRVVELVGEGGMGRVYLAEHARLGRRVALKLLHDDLSGDAQAVSRFFAEARAVNRICHENIVEITDFIENPGGDNYYIMEFLPGLNLDQLVKRDGSLSLARALGISVQVCAALAAVHEAEIIHRDLKPENIFLTERGGQKDFVKVLDFGIAKLSRKEDEVSMHKTGAGIIMGTPEYMSPEQASGVAVDYRSDIYAMGIILYELVTGQNPFAGGNFGEMLVRKLSSVAPAPSSLKNLKTQIPRELDELILRCLERDREKRPTTIREVEQQLRAIAGSHAFGLETFTGGLPAVRRRRWAMPAAAAAGVIVVASVIGLSMRRAPAPPPVVVRTANVAPVTPVVVAPQVVPPPVAAVPTPPAPEVEHAEVSRPTAAKKSHGLGSRKKMLEGPTRRAVIDAFK